MDRRMFIAFCSPFESMIPRRRTAMIAENAALGIAQLAELLRVHDRLRRGDRIDHQFDRNILAPRNRPCVRRGKPFRSRR